MALQISHSQHFGQLPIFPFRSKEWAKVHHAITPGEMPLSMLR